MEKIITGQNIISHLKKYLNFSLYSKITILTDQNVSYLWLEKIKKEIGVNCNEIIIKAGEKEKNINTAIFIWKKMLDFGLDRRSLLINLGGGVILDLGGFVASVYMRGIKFINIPTTLLAMVDASIGGKTGIDFLGVKNILGTFALPEMVFIDIDFLKTLPNRYFLEGWAEIMKHGIIADREYFNLVIKKEPKEYSDNELETIIKKSILIKSIIVDQDTKERGLRKVLNFGHTLGHAFESWSLKRGKILLHGEAVAIGILGESILAEKICLLSYAHRKKIEDGLKKNGLLRIGLNLIKNFNINEMMALIKKDKKNINGEILFSLPKKIGEVVYDIKIKENLLQNFLANFPYE